MTKMTYAVALNSAIACEALSPEVKEKLSALLAQVEKKGNAERKPTATQTANAMYKQAIEQAMAYGKGYTITDLIKLVPEIAELSNQRVSAIVRQMKDEGILVREEIKRKAYFSLADEGDDPNQYLEREIRA